MADIAMIGLGVDTRPLKEGERALRDLGKTGTQTERELSKATGQIESGFSNVHKMIALVTAGLAALGAGGFLSDAIKEQEKLQRNIMRTEQIIKATGRAAGFGAKELADSAKEIAWNTLQSTEGIMAAQQILLTFRNVQGDVFSRGIKLANDMAVTIGGDLNGAITQLGKALNDPLQGMNALSRVGVAFSASQEKLIKGFMKTGEIAKAQEVILQELAIEYKDTASAEAMGLAGAQDTLGQSIQEVKVAIADYIDAGVKASGVNAALSSSIIKFTTSLKNGELKETIDDLKVLGAGLGGAALGYAAVTVALNAQTIALRIAAIAQGIFNATARANPYILLATGIAAATAALYQYNTQLEDSTKNTVDFWKKAAKSETEYAMAKAQEAQTQKEWNSLVSERESLERKLAKTLKMADGAKGSRKNSLQSVINAQQKEIDLIKDKQRAIQDARMEADKAESNRQAAAEALTKASQDEINANTQKEVADAARAITEKERIANAKQLQDAYHALLLTQKEQIELWGDDSALAKLNFDLKNTELSKLLPKEKELLRIQAAKIDALKAEEEAKANQKQTDDFMAQQGQELDALRNSYATKNEIVYQAYLAREAIIQRAEARGSVLESEAAQLRNESEKQLSDERVAIAKEEADKKKELDDQRLQATGQLFGNLATLMQTENRKLFEIGKAAAIAQAIVNTATAITNALAVPPYPLGLALASTAGIAGAVQIAAIQNQQFSGARAMGGDVQAGNQYLVGERGAEIITMGGNGHVTPNHKLGGGDTKVTIVNQTTGKIDRTEERRMPDGELILTVIEAVAAQTRDPNSKISRAQQQSYNLQRRR